MIPEEMFFKVFLAVSVAAAEAAEALLGISLVKTEQLILLMVSTVAPSAFS